MTVRNGEETEKDEQVQSLERTFGTLTEVGTATRVNYLGNNPRGSGDYQWNDVHLHILEGVH